MHIRLYEHPYTGAFGADSAALSLAGAFPDAVPGISYEGRIQILNSIGDCTVEMLTGSLPPGAALFVDNTTKEVVITWPEYLPEAAPIANPGFEAGTLGWLMGAGWSTTTDNAPTGAFSAQFVDFGGDSVMVNTASSAITPGTEVNALCNVRQGASSAGNAGAVILLEFLNAAGEAISTPEGNVISSGSDNEVQVSSINTTAPPLSAAVRLGCRGFRKRQNKVVWVDDFAWDVVQPAVGTNTAGESWCLSLRVTDSLGRQADWEGCISVNSGLWVASTNTDELLVSANLLDWTITHRSPALADASRTPPTAVGGGRVVVFDTSTSVELIDDLVSDPTPTTIVANALTTNSNGLRVLDGGALLVDIPSASYSDINVSQDRGATWTSYPKPAGLTAYQASAHRLGSGRWVLPGVGVFGSATKMYYTDDPLPQNWILASQSSLSNVNRAFYTTLGNDNAVCAITNGGICARTTDGVTWVLINVPGTTSSVQGRAQLVVGDVFLMQYRNRTYIRSADAGLTWTSHDWPTTGTLECLSYGNGILVGVATDGSCYKSFDLGLTWEAFSLPGGPSGVGIGFISGFPASSGVWD
jgi:hypothetical protein